MPRLSAHERVITDLLRALTTVLTTYRLFPDDPDQDGVVAAVERTREAARIALTSGPLDLEIRNGRFGSATGELSDDEGYRRLATACYDRGVEHLHLRSVPTAASLRHVAAVLSLHPDTVLAQGGVRRLLATRGVAGIRLEDIAPETGDGMIDDEDGADRVLRSLDEITPSELALLRRMRDPEGLAASLIVDGVAGDPAQTAQDLFAQLAGLHSAGDEASWAEDGFFERIRRVLDVLPQRVAREFAATVVTHMGEERFATAYLQDMGESELARLVMGLSRDGPEPVELARSIATRIGRRSDVVDLVVARAATPDEWARALPRPTIADLADADDPGAVQMEVADRLGDLLVDEHGNDVRDLREVYPATEDDLRVLGLLALRDYLRSEEDTDRLWRVLEVWGATLREAIVADDGSTDRLLAVVDDVAAAPGASPHDVAERRRVLAAATAEVLDEATVTGIVDRLGHTGEVAAAAALLRRFPGAGVDALLDLLGSAEGGGTRALVVRLLVELAPAHLDRIVTRTDDPRWFVVRNLVTIIGRGAGPAGLAPLSLLARHPRPAVRIEVVRGLVACVGDQAVPHARRLADDDDERVRGAALTALAGLTSPDAASALRDVVTVGAHPQDRRRALELLAQHPSRHADDALAALGKQRRPRLPRALRRQLREVTSARHARSRHAGAGGTA